MTRPDSDARPMTLELTATSQILTRPAPSGAYEVRVWRGKTPKGRPVLASIAQLAADDPAAQKELAAGLQELPGMGPDEAYLPVAREIAAQVWCNPAMADVEMDAEAAERIAWILVEVLRRRDQPGPGPEPDEDHLAEQEPRP